jgi:putative hydrolase of the HAD superfamily
MADQQKSKSGMPVKAVVFDFGGVLAEEGFREGLRAIGEKNGLNPDDFFTIASELIYQTGYVTGMSDESAYWKAVREKTGIAGDDVELRQEIVKRFIVRPVMLKYAESMKSSGIVIAILSDQTNWLDEIDRKTPFFHHFDFVFNSFRMKKGKRDPSIFRDICVAMGLRPDQVLFIDDNIGNIERAARQGLNVIHFKGIGNFETEIEKELNMRGNQKQERRPR